MWLVCALVKVDFDILLSINIFLVMRNHIRTKPKIFHKNVVKVLIRSQGLKHKSFLEWFLIS